MSMDQFTLGGVKIGSTVIKSIQNSSLPTGIDVWTIGGDGAARNTFSAIAKMQPEILFETTSIKIALNACGLVGATLANAEVYYNKLDNFGIRGTGVHFKGVAVAGLVFPVRLSVRQGQPATISYRGILCSANGTTIPLTITTSASALTGEGQTTELYTLGTISLNGTALDTAEGFDIDFGIEPVITHPFGLVYPTDISILRIQPKITIPTPDITAISDFFVQQGSTDSTLQLVDVSQATGLRGAAPITFSIDEGTIHWETKASASHGNKASGNLIITPVSDTVAEVIAISGLS